MKLQQFVLTKFNLEIYDNHYHRDRARHGLVIGDHTPEAWMQRRIELFRKYAYPSMVRQTQRDVDWLIVIDGKTPEHDYRKLASLIERPRTHLCRVAFPYDQSKHTENAWGKLVERFLLPETEYVLTTRFDTDDVLHCRALATIRAAAEPRIRLGLDLVSGYVMSLDTGELRIIGQSDYPNGCNMFASLLEDRKMGRLPLTVYAEHHTRLCRLGPVKRIRCEPMWIQTIHDTNVSSRMRGKPQDYLTEGFFLKR